MKKIFNIIEMEKDNKMNNQQKNRELLYKAYPWLFLQLYALTHGLF